jgi:heterodisulfide reductase subunit B
MFPGGTAKEYDASAHAVCKALGIELTELPDWSCCGASSAHVTNHDLSVALPARNLFIAQKEGMDIAVLCAACFNRLKVSLHEISKNDHVRVRMEEIMGYNFKGTVKVRHLLEIIVDELGIDALKEQVQEKLVGFKAVPYYGCLMVRPPEVMDLGHSDNPVLMDDILKSLGVEVKPWSYKAECCGGSLTLTQTDVMNRLIDNLLFKAREAGANCIVTDCPMCMMNLEMRRTEEAPNLPIFFFTELMGMALKLDGWRDWVGKHLIDASGFLEEREKDKEEAAKKAAEEAAAKAAKKAAREAAQKEKEQPAQA